jgi:carbon monoxide dehydrogenase subunit G
MTVRVERQVDVVGTPEDVWSYLAEAENRARAISVVSDWEENDDGTLTWHVSLPIPVVKRTLEVTTEDRERRPGEYVRFVGRSPAFRVQGEHELEGIEGGTRVTSRFVVDSKLPGVERYFKRQLDRELDNVEYALRDAMEVPS